MHTVHETVKGFTVCNQNAMYSKCMTTNEEYIFVFLLLSLQAILEEEEGGSCRPFIQMTVIRAFAAVFVNFV